MADQLSELPGELAALPAGGLVLYSEHRLSEEQRAKIRRQLEALLPDRVILILDPGFRVEAIDSNRRLDAIEHKLDVLIAALADGDEEPEQAALTLDGEPAGRPRDQFQELG